MLNLALWLKKNRFRVDQVQTFYPSPMALATAMYHSRRNPLKKLSYKSKKLFVADKIDERRLQKAYLRYHDPKNWAHLRESLIKMNRADLIGDGPNQLIPEEDQKGYTKKRPTNKGKFQKARGGQWDNRKAPTNKKNNTRNNKKR